MKSLAWEGSSREELVSQVRIFLTKVSDLKLELSELGQQLNNEIDLWIEADNGFNQKLIVEDNFISYSIKPPIREATYLFGFLSKRDVDDVFDYFLDDKEGKELLEACKAANLRFEYIKDGEKFYFGAENGEIIPITWVDDAEIPKSKGVYIQDTDSKSILLNNILNINYDIRETIAHEMQHAIDYKIGRVDKEIIGKPYQTFEDMNFINYSQNAIIYINWDNLESEFEASIRERVHSEIASHSRGYEFNPLDQSGEKILNMDNTYTSSEYEIILNERDYASFYEEQLEETLGTEV